MSGSIKRIDAQALKAALHDGLQIALLDAREELTFGERHILMAACMPLGRIEVLADDMVPRRHARVVWCDDGEGLGERAAQRMATSAIWACLSSTATLPPGKAPTFASIAAYTCPAKRSPRLSSTIALSFRGSTNRP